MDTLRHPLTSVRMLQAETPLLRIEARFTSFSPARGARRPAPLARLYSVLKHAAAWWILDLVRWSGGVPSWRHSQLLHLNLRGES